MAMQFGELDAKTRSYMLKEFAVEQAAPGRFLSAGLSAAGLAVFDQLMTAAIQTGSEATLAVALQQDQYWKPTNARGSRINVAQAAERLALTEFNTWYVRGFSRRLLDEQEVECEIYRAAEPKWGPARCQCLEGRRVPIQQIYDHHRVRYWPPPGDQTKLAVPFDPSCHHTIRRVPGLSGASTPSDAVAP